MPDEFHFAGDTIALHTKSQESWLFQGVSHERAVAAQGEQVVEIHEALFAWDVSIAPILSKFEAV